MPNVPDTALVVVNLGTPEAPTASAVRRYLGEFLSDKRVVSIPALLWKPLLHGMILPLRGPRSAEKYAQIWLPEGSPLAVYTQRLAQAMQACLPAMRVVQAMRYGAPALAGILNGLHRDGIRRIVVLPLYPQYSTTTTASVDDVVKRWRVAHPTVEVTMVDDYSVDAGWVKAVAASIQRQWQQHGRGERLVFSFHGLPQRMADTGDPYPQRCEASAAAIAAALGLAAEEWTLTYQSRFGRERWLEPSTKPVLLALVDAGIRKVDVVCPGFAVDCLETLEEVAIGFGHSFAAHGGQLRYLPCLNEDPAHAAALAAIVKGNLQAG